MAHLLTLTDDRPNRPEEHPPSKSVSSLRRKAREMILLRVVGACQRKSRPDKPPVIGTPGQKYDSATPALLGRALEPLPCRLSTQDLVELLKQLTCVGPARRVILDQLEHRYRQKFADHWDFVRFAQEQRLGLDFTTPPQRPVAPVAGKSK